MNRFLFLTFCKSTFQPWHQSKNEKEKQMKSQFHLRNVWYFWKLFIYSRQIDRYSFVVQKYRVQRLEKERKNRKKLFAKQNHRSCNALFFLLPFFVLFIRLGLIVNFYNLRKTFRLWNLFCKLKLLIKFTAELSVKSVFLSAKQTKCLTAVKSKKKVLEKKYVNS